MSSFRQHFIRDLPYHRVQILNSVIFLFFTLVGNLSFATPSGSSPTADCDWTQPLLTLQVERNQVRHPERRLDLIHQIEETRNQLSKDFFPSFLNGSFFQKIQSRCLEGIENHQGLLALIQMEFFKQSLEMFRNSKSDTLKLLMNLLDSKYGRDTTIIFRLAGGNAFQAAPAPLNAGFHRGQSSIFMDITRISSSEWFVILAHELVHFLDVKIQQGGLGFSDTETAQLMVQWAQRTANPSDLSTADHERIERWLEHGLDRGLLAEARAWTLTLQIYQEGLRENLWGKTPWIDEILSHRRENETLREFSLRYLTMRTYQPEESLFVWPLARNLLKELIQKFLIGAREWNFGILETLLK